MALFCGFEQIINFSYKKRPMKYFKDLNNNHIKTLKMVEKQAKHIKYDKILRDLVKEKMVMYDKKYALTYKGYDHLVLAHFKKKGLTRVIDQIDIGKESDIYLGEMNGERVVLKMYRIGRTSYRRTENRDITKMCMYKRSMMYCKKEYDILKLLNGNNIVEIIDYNRHCLVTKYYECKPLVRTKLTDLDYFYNKLMDIIVDLYKMGYIHGDFNEYNVLIDCDRPILIDFPQCISIKTYQAIDVLRRDIRCIQEYFKRKYRYTNERNVLSEIFVDNQQLCEAAIDNF